MASAGEPTAPTAVATPPRRRAPCISAISRPPCCPGCRRARPVVSGCCASMISTPPATGPVPLRRSRPICTGSGSTGTGSRFCRAAAVGFMPPGSPGSAAAAPCSPAVAHDGSWQVWRVTPAPAVMAALAGGGVIAGCRAGGCGFPAVIQMAAVMWWCAVPTGSSPTSWPP